MTVLSGGGSVCRCTQERGPFGALRARRRRNRTAPAPLRGPWTQSSGNLQRGRSAYVGVEMGESKRKSRFTA